MASSALPSAAADRERSVFISCPADAAYRPLLRAMCFALRACGFVPRCALNHPGTAQASFAEIVDLVAGCDLSVHDLSGGAYSKPRPSLDTIRACAPWRMDEIERVIDIATVEAEDAAGERAGENADGAADTGQRAG